MVRQLERLAPRFPREVVECIGALVEGDREGWGVLMGREAIRTILQLLSRVVLTMPGARLRSLSIGLGRGGYFEFGEVLRGR